MYNKQTNDLAHHGIKGQKWGIINKKDDAQSRVASEKNRLDYDRKIAAVEANAKVSNNDINQANKTERYRITTDAKTAVTLGRQQVSEVMARESAARQASRQETERARAKYKTLGTVAVLGLFATMSIAKNNRKAAQTMARRMF